MLSVVVTALAFSTHGRPTLPQQHVRRSPAPTALAPAEVWTSYLGLLETAPLVTKACTSAACYYAGDIVGQLSTGRDLAGLDLQRSSRSAAAACDEVVNLLAQVNEVERLADAQRHQPGAAECLHRLPPPPRC